MKISTDPSSLVLKNSGQNHTVKQHASLKILENHKTRASFFAFISKVKQKSGIPFLLIYTISASLNKICPKSVSRLAGIICLLLE